MAPPIDPTVATTTHEATEFLYTGSDPIQTGVAIANQAWLPIITYLLVAILLHARLGTAGGHDVKALTKQEKRQKAQVDDPDGTDRPDWTVPLFRSTAKVSRQVLRFFKYPFLKPASPGLYERELAPMLKAYL